MMYASGLTHLKGILHTEYNEYDSIIKPILIYLESQGVQFRTNTTVTDITVDNNLTETVVTGLTYKSSEGEEAINLNRKDLVIFTNGSLTQNATLGDTNTIAKINYDVKDRGCFTLWEKLASIDPKFGNPANFISNVDKSNFISFFPTFKGDRTFFDYMEKKTGNIAGTGGAMTIVDSSWKISFVLYGKYYPDQPEDVQVLWAYGQCSDVPGDYIKKPMQECTGAEMMAELLYHCGLKDKITDILKNVSVSTATLPYTTSQFMPRKISDRPKVIPDGCVNLAFIGQFVELPGDVVFTVETSVRTAMMAVWGLTHLDKPMIPLFEPMYDIRAIAGNIKATTGIKQFSPLTLPMALKGGLTMGELVDMFNHLPDLPC